MELPESFSIPKEWPGLPAFRATIADGRLTIVRWHHRLSKPTMRYQPSVEVFRSRGEEGVTIANLTVVRRRKEPRELIVKFLCDGELEPARETIVRWAGLVDYGRVWLPDELVETQRADVDHEGVGLDALPSTETECPGCMQRWQGGGAMFWLDVRNSGHFRLECNVCGTTLPQWVGATERVRT